MGNKVGRKICEWLNDCQEEVDYRLNHWGEYGFDECPSEDDVRKQVDEDCEWTTGEWEYMCFLIDESTIKLKSTTGYWFAEVENFGWRSLHGHAVIKATTAQELLERVLPKCDCVFKVYKLAPGGIAINNAHHDSPTWAEWYYVRPISRTRYERERGIL